jgi:hypothetical protein
MSDNLQSLSSLEPVYESGYPTEETARAAFYEYDFQAAVQFYVWGYAYLDGLGFDKGLARIGGDENSIYVFDKRMQPQHRVMTANDEVIYATTRLLDLTEGPWVVEVPPRCRGHIFDIGQRAYEDVGDVGPDGGKGGKFLLVARDYDGDIPDGYFPVPARYSDLLFCGLRTFPESEGGLAGAVAQTQKMRVYRLSEADAPADQNFVLIGDREFSGDWPRDQQAFEWLAEVAERDRLPAEAHAHLGNMRRLGLVVGKGFHPDERARHILERAAKTAEAIVLSMAFRNRVSKPVYDNRQWEFVFHNRSSQFLADNYEEIEERAGSWHYLISNFAHQVPAKPGTGQFPLCSFRDADGGPLKGSKLYRLTIPADVPVEQFWQFPVYSTRTRSFVQTDQGRATITSTDEGLITNDDGSVNIYIGPKVPEGFEPNWIKTNPDEGWFTILRLYAPLEPILKKEWVPNDIELVE